MDLDALRSGIVALNWREMVDQTDPWRLHRILKRIGLASILVLFLTIGLVLFEQINMRSRGFHVFVYGWMLFVLVMLTGTHEARCPRCHRRFYAKGAEFWQMTTECLHCGQEKYADLGARPKPKAGSSGE